LNYTSVAAPFFCPECGKQLIIQRTGTNSFLKCEKCQHKKDANYYKRLFNSGDTTSLWVGKIPKKEKPIDTTY